MEAPRTIPNGPDPTLSFAFEHRITQIRERLAEDTATFARRKKEASAEIEETLETYRELGLSKALMKTRIELMNLDAKDATTAAKRQATIAKLAKKGGDIVVQLELFQAAIEHGRADFFSGEQQVAAE